MRLDGSFPYRYEVEIQQVNMVRLIVLILGTIVAARLLIQGIAWVFRGSSLVVLRDIGTKAD